ncbi:MAG: 50S ribosomal protein L30 [Gammaproteobacteria bacterium]
MSDKVLKIKLIKSPIGRIERHKLCVKGLGFRKLHQIVILKDTPSIRGLVNKIRDMVEIVEG